MILNVRPVPMKEYETKLRATMKEDRLKELMELNEKTFEMKQHS